MRENPVVRAVGRDLGLGKPRAVHRAKQIILGTDGLVEVRLIDAAGQRQAGREQSQPAEASAAAGRSLSPANSAAVDAAEGMASVDMPVNKIVQLTISKGSLLCCLA